MPTSTDDFPIMPQTGFIITFVHKRTFALDWAPLRQKPWETRRSNACNAYIYLENKRKHSSNLLNRARTMYHHTRRWQRRRRLQQRRRRWSWMMSWVDLCGPLNRLSWPPTIENAFASLIFWPCTLVTLPKWLLLSLRKLRQTYAGGSLSCIPCTNYTPRLLARLLASTAPAPSTYTRIVGVYIISRLCLIHLTL